LRFPVLNSTLDRPLPEDIRLNLLSSESRQFAAVFTLVLSVTACGSSSGSSGTSNTPLPAVLAGSLDAGGIVVFKTDTTTPKTLTSTAGQMVKASPSGTSLVFNNTGESVAFGAPMYTVDMNGTVFTVDTPAGNSGDAFPSFSRDGTWIFFSRYIAGKGQLWWVHPDGSGAAALTTQNPGSDYWPTGSPDGTKVAYVDILTNDLRVLTIATGAVTDLGITPVHSPQWSPTGNVIAYLMTGGLTGELGIANSDGTNPQVLSVHNYEWGIDFSPDGKWIAARNAATGLIELINVSTKQITVLTSTGAITGTIGSPTWISGGASYRRVSPNLPVEP
jgi:Tol biopolymer transport system component